MAKPEHPTQEKVAALEIPTRAEAIRKHKEGGGRVAAVLPIYYSRALLRAHGVLPVEVWGPPRTDPSRGDAHLQAYTCSIVRAALSFQLSGGMDAADIIVVPHACDSLQGLGSLLLDFVDTGRPVLPLYVPRCPSSSGTAHGAVRFLAEELRRFGARLVEATGVEPSLAELSAAVDVDVHADGILARLHADRRRLGMSDREIYRLLRAREYLPAEGVIALSAGVLDRPPSDPSPGVPVLLTGIVPEPYDLLDVISEAGGVVAADDFAACGRRLYPAGVSADPHERMAERILHGPPCSMRGSPVAARIARLRALASESGARAVIFYLVKFCEPELFYVPQIRRALEQHGLRTLIIEVDLCEALQGQVVTRIEALMETITKGGRS